MPLRRLHNWSSLGEAAIRARAQTPFVWGGHDCCLSVCDVIAQIAGGDPAAWFRGRYASALGATRALRSYLGRVSGGYEEIFEPAVASLAMAAGFTEVPVLHAGRLDVALARTARGSALALVDFDGRSLLIADDPGWSSLPLTTAATRAWRIPT